MQRDGTVTWGVVDEDAEEEDSTEADHDDGFGGLVASLGVRRRLLGGVIGLAGLSVLLVGAYTITDPILLSFMFLVAPAFLLLLLVGFLRGGDLVDPRV